MTNCWLLKIENQLSVAIDPGARKPCKLLSARHPKFPSHRSLSAFAALTATHRPPGCRHRISWAAWARAALGVAQRRKTNHRLIRTACDLWLGAPVVHAPAAVCQPCWFPGTPPRPSHRANKPRQHGPPRLTAAHGAPPLQVPSQRWHRRLVLPLFHCIPL
jgi:hypothetical protein